ncbi:hypothetical protein BKK80_24910 [Cupriavidus malaysiensis]|uniref:Major facilitator superfamily (MFS) profile domain-containing protein n=2 Tax=Cupriavidus malaysiensis TaxID=367825 RepID=A0A1D9IAL8_9BURK|nr:hypothetical protein BKK80_24910 [Cupriavidus malaysiensis]
MLPSRVAARPDGLPPSARPVPMPASLVRLLAVACALSVANVYYAQPLLDAVARDFGIPPATVGGIITATQAGCALALVTLVPLGDRLERRRLLALQLVLLAVTALAVAAAPTPALLLAGMLGMGLFGTAMTQGLIAYAATLAEPGERGRVVGAAQGGVVIGLLLARTLAGLVADAAGWRAVYLASALLAGGMLVWLGRRLPAVAAPPRPPSYAALLRSMLALLAQERTLQVRGMIGLLMFAAFSAFWSALVLPLSAPPFSMSHAGIGAFGLVGAVGALAAARAGRLADRGLGQRATGLALLCLAVSWLPIGMLPTSMAALVAGIVLLDLGGQAVHVINQAMILQARPQAQGRLVGCYMLFYAAGSGFGALASTLAYDRAGWSGVCLLGFSLSLLAALFWAATLPRR